MNGHYWRKIFADCKIFLCVVSYCVRFNFSWKWAAVGAGIGAAVFGAPVALAAAGFTTAGITGGSIAAWMMSLYGGAVLSGSVVAVLQSIGAAGMGPIATAVVAYIGGTAGGAVFDAYERKELDDVKRKEKEKEVVEGLTTCLMSPCGGNFDEKRTEAVLILFAYYGINSIGNEADKIGLKKCLKTMKLMGIMD